MKQEGIDEFFPMTEKFEGKVPWMYLDILGLVTLAIGNLVDSPAEVMSLPFFRLDGTPATDAEISEEWHRIKAGGCGHYTDPLQCARTPKCFAHAGHMSTKNVCKLRLTEEGIRDLVLRKLAQNDATLTHRFPEFQDWPWEAQLATHSVSWACGTAFRFPKLEAALRAQDFARAVLECTISEVGNPGVAPRNVCNRELFEAAARGEDGSPAVGGQ